MLTLLAVIFLLLAWTAVVVYVKSRSYRQIEDSWILKENRFGLVIGDLGGMPVSIPHHFAHFVEYEGDPRFLEPRKGTPPMRGYQSKLRSFGFEVRFPDMMPLTDETRQEKNK